VPASTVRGGARTVRGGARTVGVPAARGGCGIKPGGRRCQIGPWVLLRTRHVMHAVPCAVSVRTGLRAAGSLRH
jgi:hypothetical protein